MTDIAIDCIFCDIISGRAPATIVHEDDLVLAVMDIRPVTAGHMLIMPRVHVANFVDIEQETASRLILVAQRLAAALADSGLPHEGTNLFYADGEAAFQEVFHAHLHVIPRFPGDGFRISAAGWSSQPTREDLAETGAKIREALARTG